MAMQPIKPSIQADFRNELGVSDAPSSFESNTPLTPVGIVAGNIGFAKTRSNEEYLIQGIQNSTASRVETQIATPDSNYDYYVVGLTVYNAAAAAGDYALIDATSGTIPAYPTTNILSYLVASNPTTNQVFLPIPAKVKTGLRVSVPGAGSGSHQAFVHYIRVSKTV